MKLSAPIYFFLGAMLTLSHTVYADTPVYTWVDHKGTMTFSDRHPGYKIQKVNLTIIPGSSEEVANAPNDNTPEADSLSKSAPAPDASAKNTGTIANESGEIGLVPSILPSNAVITPPPEKNYGSRSVKLYSTSRCGYCKMIKSHLQGRNIKFTEYDVETDPTGKSHFKRLRAAGVPIVLVGNQRMDGYMPSKLDTMLRNVGYTVNF